MTEPQYKKRNKGIFMAEEYRSIPLDIAIMKILPMEGTKRGKYLWEAKDVKAIRRDLEDNTLTTSMISGRLRVLRGFDLVVEMPLISKTWGWQVTSKGAELNGKKSE